MENSLEFTIPEGYELDKKKSTSNRVVYKKVKKYKPKDGDLVFVETFDRSQKFIFLYGKNYYQTPSLKFGLSECPDEWRFHWNSPWVYTRIRPATVEEAALFTHIMAENGYEYNPEKKEVRKKRWRAKVGESYYYITTLMDLKSSCEYYTRIDNELYTIGNYFQTLEQAEEKIEEFKEILSKN